MKIIATGWRVEMTLPLKTRRVAVNGRVVHRQARATPYGDVYIHGVEFDNAERNVLDAIELHCAHHATPLERQGHEGVQGLSNTLRRRVPRIGGQPSVSVGVPARIRVGTDENAYMIGIGLVETVSRSGARLLLDNDVVIGSLLQAQVAGSTHTVTGRVGLVHAFDSSIGTRFVAIVDTVPAAGRTSTHRWYDAIARFAMEQHMRFSKSRAISRISAEVRLLLGASTEPFPSQGAPVMDQLTPQRPDARTAMPTVPALLTVLGPTARIEGKFQIAESIEVQCDISGELKVGGTLLIGERGRVSADVSTVNAVIRGTYTGNLKASGSVEIATSGRVTGTVESNELVIGKGAIFTGTVTHVEKELQEQLGTDITQAISDVEKPISRLIELDVAGNALGDTGKPARGRTLGLS
jgi:cytoskeletal protein CcmA (bactofilin family)